MKRSRSGKPCRHLCAYYRRSVLRVSTRAAQPGIKWLSPSWAPSICILTLYTRAKQGIFTSFLNTYGSTGKTYTIYRQTITSAVIFFEVVTYRMFEPRIIERGGSHKQVDRRAGRQLQPAKKEREGNTSSRSFFTS